MYCDIDQWITIRRRVLVQGVSKRQILRETGMHWRTLEKILQNPQPPGHRRAIRHDILEFRARVLAT